MGGCCLFPLLHKPFCCRKKEKKRRKTSNCYRKKKTVCAVELRLYNTRSTLLFCRYVNALRTLPDPLGCLHLKRSRRGGAVLFIQHHLIDSVVGRRLGRLGVFQLVFVHRVSRIVVGALRQFFFPHTFLTETSTTLSPLHPCLTIYDTSTFLAKPRCATFQKL